MTFRDALSPKIREQVERERKCANPVLQPHVSRQRAHVHQRRALNESDPAESDNPEEANRRLERDRGLGDRLLTPAEVCERVRLSSATLYRLRRKGKFP